MGGRQIRVNVAEGEKPRRSGFGGAGGGGSWRYLSYKFSSGINTTVKIKDRRPRLNPPVTDVAEIEETAETDTTAPNVPSARRPKVKVYPKQKTSGFAHPFSVLHMGHTFSGGFSRLNLG